MEIAINSTDTAVLGKSKEKFQTFHIPRSKLFETGWLTERERIIGKWSYVSFYFLISFRIDLLSVSPALRGLILILWKLCANVFHLWITRLIIREASAEEPEKALCLANTLRIGNIRCVLSSADSLRYYTMQVCNVAECGTHPKTKHIQRRNYNKQTPVLT